MKVALLGEGTYPIVEGGVSTWTDQLIRGMSEHQFGVLCLVGADRAPVWRLPSNVRWLRLVPMWEPLVVPGPRGVDRARRWGSKLRDVLQALWTGALPASGEEPELETVEWALVELAELPAHVVGRLPETSYSAQAILGRWPEFSRSRGLSAMSGSQAARVARYVDRTLALTSIQWPEADLIHVSANGSAVLVGLVRHWQDRVPMVLTEHGVYLRERYLALGGAGYDLNERVAMMALTGAVCRLGYRRSRLLTPVSQFNQRWAEAMGASAQIARPITNGVEPGRFAATQGEPAAPIVVWVGRIDPLKDLITLVEAFDLVRRRIPDARLRLYGGVPRGNEGYATQVRDRVKDLALSECIEFAGPCANPVEAYSAGQVVVLSSISEGMPFTVIEAMMTQRATVSTDVGGVSEVVGADARCGLLVDARDPASMAEGIADLLQDPDRRQQMARAARDRALAQFSVAEVIANYRQVYDHCLTGVDLSRWSNPARTEPTVAVGPRRSWAAAARVLVGEGVT